ncbi:prolyl 4-hydroxylase subunit alpha-1 [Patella vulgata]|uniref:prolyl 4-hydroxylase subunit alpha-1 n=1 Tax=Patella vulgata TaxID=6465 RepID=UPI0021800C5F|nr:prolyl 4-hydroxylase subunit alpha-1 [Patella vulgata]
MKISIIPKHEYVYLAFVCWIVDFHLCFGEVFTAICKLRELPAKEQALIATFDRFLKDQKENYAINELKEFVEKMREENRKVLNDSHYVENPINSFQLLYRTVHIWGEKLSQYLHYPTYNNKSLPYFMNSVFNNTQQMSSWPKQFDLRGASMALVRLRYIYNLDIEDIRHGRLPTSQTHGLSGNDLLTIGQTATQFDNQAEAILWLTESIAVLSKDPQNNELVIRAYRSLADIFVRFNAPHMALDMMKTALHIDPNNSGVKRDMAIYNDVMTDYVKHLRPFLTILEITNLKRDAPIFTPNYAELCRGEIKTPEELSQLSCRFRETQIPFIFAKEEEVNSDPAILVFHDVISDSEIEQLQKIAHASMRRSTVVERDSSIKETEVRISNNAWIYDSESVADKLSRRIEMITGLSALNRNYDTHAEPYQIVNYGLGGMYDPHFDSLAKDGQPKSEDEAYRNSGERTATWMFYLSDVLSGGATVFPKLKARVQVKKGSAAFWFNTHRNGFPDMRTLHAGCPILEGDKWVANKWLRSIGQTFRRPCALNPNL